MRRIHESFLLIMKSSAYAAETNNNMVEQEFLSSANGKGALTCIWEIEHENHDKYIVCLLDQPWFLLSPRFSLSLQKIKKKKIVINNNFKKYGEKHHTSIIAASLSYLLGRID